MKCVPISEARRLARETGATQMVIIGLDDDGHVSGTTYGATKAQCRALGRWLDDRHEDIAIEIDEAVRGARRINTKEP